MAGVPWEGGRVGVGFGLGPEAFGFAVLVVRVFFEGLVDPAAFVAAGFDFKVADDFEVGAGLEFLDLELALGEDGEGGGLDPAAGGGAEASGWGVASG